MGGTRFMGAHIMIRIFLGVVLAGVLLGPAGCKDKGAEGGSATGEIVIGEYASLTGATATFGQSSHNGLMLALEEINQKPVLGRTIRVITEDDRSDASEANTAVQKLISRDKVVVVIGEVASKRSLAGGSVCQKFAIPMVSPASTNPAVTQIGDYIFRCCFTDDFQGTVGAQFALKEMAGIKKEKWGTVAVFTDAANDYSKGLSKAFKDYYPNHGGRIVAEESYREGDSDFRSQLSKIKSQNPQAVFLPGYYTDIGKIVRQARELQLDVPFFGGDGWDSSETLKLGAAADNCFFTNHYSPDDPRGPVQEFIQKYKARYNEIPDAMAILGYDAMRVTADAIQRAGKAEPRAIRDALAATKDFPGASGTITMDANRNARKPIVVLRINGGKTELVDSLMP